MNILYKCGMFIGETCGPTTHNRKGQFENLNIVNMVEKPYLRGIQMDPKAQKPLPTYKDLIPDPSRRRDVLEIMKKQGLQEDKIWGFKCCKGVTDWPVWNGAFPNAQWIIVRRNSEAILDSVKRTSFMSRRNTRESWQEWVDYHLNRFEDMKKALTCYEVWSDKFLEGDYSDLWFLPEIGLKWTSAAEKVVDLSLTRP